LKIRLQIIAVLLAFVLALPVVAGELPPAFDARYRVELGGMTLGEVTITLQYENGEYHYRKKTKTKGLVSIFRRDTITESSTGKIEANDIVVSSYRFLHKKRKKPKESTVDFSLAGLASGVHKGQPYSINVPDHVFDRASVELALMRDSGAKALTYHVVQKGRLAHYSFRLQGEKNYVLPAGEFSCEEYQVERSNAKRRTTICLSDELNNLPVRATHDEKGKIVTMSLVSVEFQK